MIKVSAKLSIVLAIVLGCLALPVQGVDIELAEDSTLEGILQRGKLRIGIEAGYMPFEMIDKRSGLRQRDLRHGDMCAAKVGTCPSSASTSTWALKWPGPWE